MFRSKLQARVRFPLCLIFLPFFVAWTAVIVCMLKVSLNGDGASISLWAPLPVPASPAARSLQANCNSSGDSVQRKHEVVSRDKSLIHQTSSTHTPRGWLNNSAWDYKLLREEGGWFWCLSFDPTTAKTSNSHVCREITDACSSSAAAVWVRVDLFAVGLPPLLLRAHDWTSKR